MRVPTLREEIDFRAMSGYQWILVSVATLLMATEGYDVQAMAFTSNAVTADLGLTGSELGLVLSGGLIGMVLGSILVGPFADRFGRRPLLLIALSVNAAGLLLTATADSMTALMVWRVLTGIGIGGIMASSVVLVSEYSNAKHRALALAVFSSGFPVGATVGGLLSVPLIDGFGWQGVFVAGGILTLTTIAVVAVFVPESIDHMASRYRRGETERSVRRARTLARRMRIDTDFVLSAPSDAEEPSRSAYATLLSRGQYRSTLTLWLLFFLVMACFYFVTSWTPRLFAESGLSEEAGIYSGVILMAGGIVGNISYGFFSSRWDVRRVMSVFAVASAALMVIFVSSTSVLVLALAAGLLLGALINGCMAALYTIGPMAYSSDLRSTGVGAALAAGRLGGILAPIAIGALFDAGWAPFALYALGGGTALVAAGIVLLVTLEQRQGTSVRSELTG